MQEGPNHLKTLQEYYVMATTDRKDVEKALSLLVEIEKKLVKIVFRSFHAHSFLLQITHKLLFCFSTFFHLGE